MAASRPKKTPEERKKFLDEHTNSKARKRQASVVEKVKQNQAVRSQKEKDAKEAREAKEAKKAEEAREAKEAKRAKEAEEKAASEEKRPGVMGKLKQAKEFVVEKMQAVRSEVKERISIPETKDPTSDPTSDPTTHALNELVQFIAEEKKKKPRDEKKGSAANKFNDRLSTIEVDAAKKIAERAELLGSPEHLVHLVKGVPDRAEENKWKTNEVYLYVNADKHLEYAVKDSKGVIHARQILQGKGEDQLGEAELNAVNRMFRNVRAGGPSSLSPDNVDKENASALKAFFEIVKKQDLVPSKAARLKASEKENAAFIEQSKEEIRNPEKSVPELQEELYDALKTMILDHESWQEQLLHSKWGGKTILVGDDKTPVRVPDGIEAMLRDLAGIPQRSGFSMGIFSKSYVSTSAIKEPEDVAFSIQKLVAIAESRLKSNAKRTEPTKAFYEALQIRSPDLNNPIALKRHIKNIQDKHNELKQSSLDSRAAKTSTATPLVSKK